MKYFLLISLFSFLHYISAQSYSYCYPYSSYNSYYYFYNNGAYCCYKYSYRSSYISSSYAYCPYYTTATTVPATTSLSNYCRSYYYSYYYSSSCCYKKVRTYNTYYSSNYYYTTGDCDIATTTTQAPSSCYYYYYSSSYETQCCNFRDYSYYYPTYDTYCPTKSALTSKCGSGCCSASVPVYNGYETFYYYQYFCPETTSRLYSYCGAFCGMAAAFGTVGCCCCICGIAFTIAYCILIDKIIKKKKRAPNQFNSVPTSIPTAAGLQDSTVGMIQNWTRESLPPQIPGYTFVANPAYTADTLPYPVQLGGATNVPPNPVYVPSIVTHGAAPYPTFSQPVQTSANDDGTYVSIN